MNDTITIEQKINVIDIPSFNGFEITMDIVNKMYVNVHLLIDTDVQYSNIVIAGNILTLPDQQEWINVLDYVVGDGVTDDTVAMQNLFSDTTKENIYIPAGVTILTERIKVENHIGNIFGGGSIKLKPMEGQSFLPPAFLIGDTNRLLIDNIDFSHHDTSSYSPTHGDYGFIMFDYGKNIDNAEIRNCTFDGDNNQLAVNQIRVSLKKGYSFRNVYIHDNNFLRTQRFGIETFGYSEPDGSVANISNFNIYRNNFDNTNVMTSNVGEHGALSNVFHIGSNCTIHNNTFNGMVWDIEYGSCGGYTIRNNLHKNTIKQYFSLSSCFTDSYIRNNHMESDVGGHIHAYSAARALQGNIYIADNFIKGSIWKQQTEGINLVITGNTIVKDVGAIGDNYAQSAYPILFETDTNIFKDNTIYKIGSVSGYQAIRISDAVTSSSKIENITVYSTDNEDCFMFGSAYNNNNTCIKNYTGAIPTMLNGAGIESI